MARYGVTKQKDPTKTRNKAGGIAYDVRDPSERMLHIVGQMFNEPQYYPDTEGTRHGLTSEAQAVVDTAEEIAKSKNWADLLAIAAWARAELHMRTTPTVLFAVAAEHLPKNPAAVREDGRAHLRVYAEHVLQRGDEPRNALAAWRALYGPKPNSKKTIPNALKRAIADRLVALPEHLLAKYDSPGAPTLRDTIRLCARGGLTEAKLLYFVDREAWEKVADQTPVLQARRELARVKSFGDEAKTLIRAAKATWENVISQFGSSQEAWAYILPQMGYMATMRNLRNMVEAGVDLAPALAKISDRDEVLRSKQLPFRFLSAARAIGWAGTGRAGWGMRQAPRGKVDPQIIDAIDEALSHSVGNLPRLPGATAFFVDNSGSMSQPVSAKSTVSMCDAANMLGAMFARLSDRAYIYAFTSQPNEVQIRKADSVLTNMARIAKAGGDGVSTNAWLCPPRLKQQGRKVDRIVLVSDMQCWDSTGGWGSGGGNRSFRNAMVAYRKWAGQNTWLHTINMAGTVQAQVADQDPNTNLLSGFSDQTVKLIAAAEGIVDGIVDESRATPSIEAIRNEYTF